MVLEVNARPQMGAEAIEKFVLSYMGPKTQVPVYVLVLSNKAHSLSIPPGRLLKGLNANVEVRHRTIYRGSSAESGAFASTMAASKAALLDQRTQGLLCVISEPELQCDGLPAPKVDYVFHLVPRRLGSRIGLVQKI